MCEVSEKSVSDAQGDLRLRNIRVEKTGLTACKAGGTSLRDVSRQEQELLYRRQRQVKQSGTEAKKEELGWDGID